MSELPARIRELVTAYRPDSGQREEASRRGGDMARRVKTKYVHEGKYAAAVSVSLIDDDTGWSPYLSLEDAYRLDDVRDALRQGDLETASR